MRLSVLLLSLLLFQPSITTASEIVINAVGDVMLGGNAGSKLLRQRGYDYPFAATAMLLRSADITMGNLEAPITSGGTEFRNKRFRFRCNPKTATALRNAGFSLVTLANNHILDYGIAGLEHTLSHLSRAAISFTGAGADLSSARQPALISVKGKTIAFLAYSLTLPAEFFATPFRGGTAPGFPGYIKKDIARARSKSDHVVVSFHWGDELAALPKPTQAAAARAAIDAGAVLVLGHHPHVLQGIEHYKNGVILYSLGNFAFASSSVRSDRSVIARITLDEGVEEVELLPLNVLNSEVKLQPAALSGRRGKRVIDHIAKISAGMGTVIVSDGGRWLALPELRTARVIR
ncbi:CapA family protein [Geobacter sp. DSM 9736]|uniref:CapA family protein n=1 Tax=Geobacter sp. DSM 9736 TaxID=1277350 RepID=UPI000B5048F6|nr:CapA family protein [Geobacter sp. DSM 9736]SNB47374.1 poly-gamma-glutamate synthesis protein (capsule biosynthesis protein) [Geobacter sp. DSM 9736]